MAKQVSKEVTPFNAPTSRWWVFILAILMGGISGGCNCTSLMSDVKHPSTFIGIHRSSFVKSVLKVSTHFNKDIQLCNHNNQDIEHFYHPKKSPCALSSLIHLRLQPSSNHWPLFCFSGVSHKGDQAGVALEPGAFSLSVTHCEMQSHHFLLFTAQ